ncbi:Plipastatin synthase subunit C [compost metagenome]
MISAHHLLMDGVSWRILIEDLHQLMDQSLLGKDLHLPNKTESFQSWSIKLQEYSQSIQINNTKSWLIPTKYLAITQPQFISFVHSSSEFEPKVGNITRIIDKKLSLQICGTANRAVHTEPQDLMTTALVMALSDITGLTNIVLEMENHGRIASFSADVGRTLGWFTTMIPAIFEVAQGDDLFLLISGVKEELRRVSRDAMIYGLLKYRHKQELTEEQLEAKYPRFNYLGDLSLLSSKTLVLDPKGTRLDISKHDRLPSMFDLNVFLLDGNLHYSLMYNVEELSHEVANQLLERVTISLDEISKYCNSQRIGRFTPSDFDTTSLSQEELDSLFY